MRYVRLSILLCAALLAACARTPDPEEQARLQQLRTELDNCNRDIIAAEAQREHGDSGLAGSLAAARVEIVRTTAALITQRIQALESGADITVQTPGTKPDPERAAALEAEITREEARVAEAEAKAEGQPGLVGAMARMAAATERNSLAMLRQAWLIARFGLAPVVAPAPASASGGTVAAPAPAAASGAADATVADDELREQIITVTLQAKRFEHVDYQDFMAFDLAYDARGLDKPARAVKGVMRFTDLFGEQRFGLKWVIEKPIAPGSVQTEKGSGFEYNQFIDSHQWVRNTDAANMKVRFRVDSILYADGSTRSFD